MSKIIVIFGAGASYDLLDVKLHENNIKWRPPLTKELFDKRFDFVINGLHHMKMRLSGLRTYLNDNDAFERGNVKPYSKRVSYAL